jgi:hypothetical protein
LRNALRGRNTAGRAASASTAMLARAIMSIRAEIGHCTDEKPTKLNAMPFAGTSRLLLRIRSKTLRVIFRPHATRKLLDVVRNQTDNFMPVNFITDRKPSYFYRIVLTFIVILLENHKLLQLHSRYYRVSSTQVTI